MQKHKKLFVLAGVGAALVFGLATAALAEEFHDPFWFVQVGANGSDADHSALVAVSQGGCARGQQVAVAVDTGGSAGGACGNGDASGNRLAISRGGCADANVSVAIGPSDNCSYEARSERWFRQCRPPRSREQQRNSGLRHR